MKRNHQQKKPAEDQIMAIVEAWLAFRCAGDATLARREALLEARAPKGGSEVVDMVPMWLLRNDQADLRGEGIALLIELAEMGRVASTYNLAIEKLRGINLPLDQAGAKVALSWVAEQEHWDARLIGMAYNTLGDVALGEKRLKDALAHYSRAVGYGIQRAAYNAGLILEGKLYGEQSVQRDFARAAKLYTFAIGDPEVGIQAQTNLGLIHLGELMGMADPSLGRRLLKKSIDEGDLVAGSALKTLTELRRSRRFATGP